MPAVSGPPPVHQLPRERPERGLPPHKNSATCKSVSAASSRHPEWKARYAVRSGVEGTINEFAHGHGMRRCRYRGRPKAHLQHVLTAIAVNIERLSGRPVTEENSSPRPPTAFRPSWIRTRSPGRSPGEPSVAEPDHPRSPTESTCWPGRSRRGLCTRTYASSVSRTEHASHLGGEVGLRPPVQTAPLHKPPDRRGTLWLSS
ncbi:transposase [Streptomyces sp. NPDC002845]